MPTTIHRTAAAVAVLAIAAGRPLAAQDKASDSRTREIAAVLSHPLFEGPYVCSEHAAGQLDYLGDDLGQDCLPAEVAFDARGSTGFPRLYRDDGRRNEDWYGWNRPVLAPASGAVLRVAVNPVTNTPGAAGSPPASFILLRTTDGTFYLVAHIQAPLVAAGDVVTAGQPIARVGNNGFGRMPHIHVGAWRGRDALQIRWNQQRMTADR